MAKLQKKERNLWEPTLREMGFRSHREFRQNDIACGAKTWIKKRHIKTGTVYIRTGAVDG